MVLPGKGLEELLWRWRGVGLAQRDDEQINTLVDIRVGFHWFAIVRPEFMRHVTNEAHRNNAVAGVTPTVAPFYREQDADR